MVRQLLLAALVFTSSCADKGKSHDPSPDDDDDAPRHRPKTSASASASASTSSIAMAPGSASATASSSSADARAAPAKVPAEFRKSSRAHTCVAALYAYSYVSKTYLKSLAGKQPGPTIPVLVDPPKAASAPTPPRPRPPRTPPKGTASALPPPPKPRTANAFSRYRSAGRNCSVGNLVQGAPDPALDPALAAAADLEKSLGKNLADANSYYSDKAYEKDAFEKGRALHKDLLADFADLEKVAADLDKALVAYDAAHPPDAPAEAEAALEVVRAGRRLVDKKRRGEPSDAELATFSADLDGLEKDGGRAAGTTKSAAKNLRKAAAEPLDTPQAMGDFMLLEVRLEEAGMRAFMVGLAPPLPHPAKPGRRPTPSADPDPDPDP